MCKVPTIEERNYNWIHNHKAGKGDELDLIVNVQLMPEWEARGFITRDVEAFREKMNEEDLPGESAVLGTRKPGDRAIRRKATARAKNRQIEKLKTVYSYESINRGEDGRTHRFNGVEEWLDTIVAAKKKSKSEAREFFNRVDRRKARHNGRAECREIPDVFMDDAEEEKREFYPERADGTVDVDFCLRHNWMFRDLDDGIYGYEYDGDDDEEMESYEEYLEGENSRLTRENSRLKREISTYKDFIGEFNLNRLYEVWLAQNGKGAM